MSQPIVVTISGYTASEVLAKLLKLAGEFGHNEKQEVLPLQPMSESAPATETEPSLAKSEPSSDTVANPSETEVAQETQASTQTEKRGRGRPPKEKPAEVATATPAVTMTQVTAPTAAVKAGSLSKEAVAETMRQVLSTKGADSLKAVLLKFNAKKFSELSETDYASFVGECQTTLAA